jgi:RNA recognition motif-containing protein
MKLCIQNLPFSTTEPQLKEFFEQVGEVSKVNLIYDKVDGRPRGFGFVEMPKDVEANEAIEQLNGRELFGRPVRIEQARERPREEGNRFGGNRERRGGDGGNRW